MTKFDHVSMMQGGWPRARATRPRARNTARRAPATRPRMALAPATQSLPSIARRRHSTRLLMSECSTLVAGSQREAVGKLCNWASRAERARTQPKLLAAGDCQIAQSRLFFVVLTVSMRALVPLSTRPRPPADLGSGSASNLDGNTRKKIGYNMNLSVVCCVRTLASRVPRLAPGSPPRVPHGRCRDTSKRTIEAGFRRSRLRAWARGEVAHRATSLSFNSQEPATAVHNYHVSGLLSPPSTETPCRTGTTVHKIPMIQYDHIDLNDMAVNAMCDLPCLKHAHSISSSRARLTHARRRPR